MNLKISEKLAQPQVYHYISWLRRAEYRNVNCTMTYTEWCYELMDELFALLERLKPVSENGVKSLWLCAQRGSINDFSQQFGSYDDLLADGDIKNYAEYEAYWREMFPDEIEWYQLDAVEDKNRHYRVVLLKHQHVLEQEGSVRKSTLTDDVSPFIEWLIESVRNSIEALEEGTYNEIVEKDLPARHRTGTILRKDLWDLYPEGRAEYFENLSQAEVEEFVACAVSDKAQLKSKLPSVTANDFYRFCAMGYKANNYAGSELSPREQYFKHADGRDSGLGKKSTQTHQQNSPRGTTTATGMADILGRFAAEGTPPILICTSSPIMTDTLCMSLVLPPGDLSRLSNSSWLSTVLDSLWSSLKQSC